MSAGRGTWIGVALGVSLVMGPGVSGARADRDLTVTVVKDPAAPIELLDATGELERYDVTPSIKGDIVRNARIRHANDRGGGSLVTTWVGRVGYVNRSDQDVIAVRFAWELFDPFDDPSGAVELTDDEELSSGQIRRRRWDQPLPKPGATQATVKVTAVRFADGTIWRPGTPAGTVAARHPAVQAERQRLLKIYQEQGTDALLKTLQE